MLNSAQWTASQMTDYIENDIVPRDPIQDLLIERNETHGSFAENGRISQGIKSLLHSGRNWLSFSPVKREGADMIASKLSRYVSGDANNPDHLRDIIGYCTLILEEDGQA